MHVHNGFVPALALGFFATALSGSTTVTLTRSPPTIMRQGAKVTVSGKVRSAPRHGRTAFELKRTSGWVVLASSGIKAGGAFVLHWRVPSNDPPGLVELRVVVLNRRGGIVARTRAQQSAIGPAPQLCAPPVPPAVNIPVGDGWIVGGRYIEGGPFPGIYNCDSQAYTVTATDSAGKVQASQDVQGGQSYTLAPLPAGTYTLNSGPCRGTATVTAGRQTKADTVCPVP